MPLPADIAQCEIRWNGYLIGGARPSGVLRCTPVAKRLFDDDPSTPALILGETIPVPVVNGTATFTLACTDDVDVTPTGWAWTIVEEIQGTDGGATYSIEVPVASVATGIDLAEVAPVAPTEGTGISLVTRSEFDAMVERMDLFEENGLGLEGLAAPVRNFLQAGDASTARDAVGAIDTDDVTAQFDAANTYTDTRVNALEAAITALLARPTRPTSLTVTGRSTTTVDLSWVASTVPPGGPSTSYRVYRNGTQIATGVTTTTYQATGLTADTDYTFVITPYNTNGDGPSSDPVTARTLPVGGMVPTIPSNLRATTWTDTTVTLDWAASTSPSGPLTGYRVFRGGVQIATPTSPTYLDTGRSPNTAYSYTVRAYNAFGDSAASDAVVVTTLPTGTAPGIRGHNGGVPGPSTTNIASTTLPAGIVNGDVGYAEVTITNITDTPTAPTSPSGSWILVDGPYANSGNTQRAWLYRKVLTTADANGALSVTFSGSARPTIGFAVVSAAADTPDQFQVFSDGSSDMVLALPTITPQVANTRLLLIMATRYVQTTGNSATLPAGWAEHRDVISTHTTSPQTGVVVASQVLGAAGTPHPAENGSFVDAATDIGWLITVGPSSAATPSAPQNLRSPTKTATTVGLAWDPPATVPTGGAVTAYKLYRDAVLIATLDDLITSYSDTGRTQNTAYSYTVRAVNAAGDGALSAALSVTTNASSAARFPGDPGVGNIYLGHTSNAHNEDWFDRRVFPGATPADPPTKRFKLAREYMGSSFGITTGIRNAMTTHSAGGRIPLVSWKNGSFTPQQIAQGAADADIDSAANFMAGLGTPVWWAYYHEPEGDIAGETVNAAFEATTDWHRQAYRRQINRIRAIATNVAICSPWYTSHIWGQPQQNHFDWRWYHPNWGGADIDSGGWDYDLVDMDGLDIYNPAVGSNLTASSRNQTWANRMSDFHQRRDDDGAQLLPYCMGEFGIYNFMNTLDDNGVTNLDQLTGMITTGAALEDLVGVVFWGTNLALWDDTEDLYPTVGARTVALRTAINANARVKML